MEKRIPVTRSSMPDLAEYVNEIEGLWETRWLTNSGEKHNQLKDKLKKYLGVEHLDLVTNGHMALETAIEVLDLKGEVITTPFTFVSTTNAITRKGLKPVFCDINENDFTIDVSKIESLITDKTCAIMPVHVYGNVCDIEKIDEIAKKHNLKVIYDAAHAFGETYKGKGVMSYGDISCMSFHATKVFHTVEGGCLAFNDKKLEQKIAQIKDFGIKNEEETDLIGTNAKMNEFCAAMGLCNLRHINENIEFRKKVCDVYRKRLGLVKGIKLSAIQENMRCNYAYFPIFVDENIYGHNRDELKDYLDKNNVGTRKYFYPAINELEAYQNFDKGNTPVAAKLSRQVLTLPLYSELSTEEANKVCDLIIGLK